MFFKGSMELHVAEIIVILLDVVKQHVRFMICFIIKNYSLIHFANLIADMEIIKIGKPTGRFRCIIE